MSALKDLSEQARFLKNANPQAYDKFIEAFSAYTAEVTSKLIEATENLQPIQGQVQQCVHLLRVLKEVSKNG